MTCHNLKYRSGNVKWVRLLAIYFLHTNYTILIILLVKLLVSLLVINFEIKVFFCFWKIFFYKLFNLNLLFENPKNLLHNWGGHDNMALCQGQMILL